MFDQIQAEYIHGLDEKLDLIKQLILRLEKLEDVESILNEIKKEIHSIKGSAGSYGYPELSTLCHNFEDYLEGCDVLESNSSFIEHSLKFVDMAKDFVKTISTGEKIDASDFSQNIEKIALQDSQDSRRVLIVDPSKTIAKMISIELRKNGFSTAVSSNGLEAFSRLIRESFDVLITSLNLLDLSGESLIEAASAIEDVNSDLKIILITSSVKKRLKTTRGDIVFEKSLDLGKNIISYLKGPTKKKLVYYINDDISLHKLVEIGFKKHENYELKCFSNPMEALLKAPEDKPDVFLVDVMMPEIDGIQTAKELNQQGLLNESKLLFFTGKSEKEHQELISLGAHGVIAKPFNPVKLICEIESYL